MELPTCMGIQTTTSRSRQRRRDTKASTRHINDHTNAYPLTHRIIQQHRPRFRLRTRHLAHTLWTGHRFEDDYCSNSMDIPTSLHIPRDAPFGAALSLLCEIVIDYVLPHSQSNIKSLRIFWREHGWLHEYPKKDSSEGDKTSGGKVFSIMRCVRTARRSLRYQLGE